MKIITTYEAFDGTQFDTEEKCLNYESEKNKVFNCISTKFDFYNKEGDAFSIRNIYEAEVAYHNAAFLEIHREITEKESKYLSCHNDILIPTAVGLYRYDNDSMDWIEYHEDIANYCERIWHGWDLPIIEARM